MLLNEKPMRVLIKEPHAGSRPPFPPPPRLFGRTDRFPEIVFTNGGVSPGTYPFASPQEPQRQAVPPGGGRTGVTPPAATDGSLLFPPPLPLL